MDSRIHKWVAAAALAAMAATGTALAQSGQDPGDSSSKARRQSDPAKPITVTPPSADNPNTSANVDTPNADANAAAGPQGVKADADIKAMEEQGQKSTSQTGVDKLKAKKNTAKTDAKDKKDEIENK